MGRYMVLNKHAPEECEPMEADIDRIHFVPDDFRERVGATRARVVLIALGVALAVYGWYFQRLKFG